MALAQTVVAEVRSTGAEPNGGGFNTAAAGTDRSQQDAAQVVIDNATILTSITTNVITFIAGYTPTSADVGNLVQMLTGTNVTATWYEITAFTGTTWTVDKNVVTSGTTVNATGNMGGGLATPGKAAGIPFVAGSGMFIKYHATNVYTSTSTTNNVASGRINISVGSTSLPFFIIGYETTHGDNTGNRPTLKWGVNAGTNTLLQFANQHLVRNLIIDANKTGLFTGTRCLGASASGLLENIKFMGGNSGGLFLTTGSHFLYNCEFTDFTTNAAVNITTAGQECQFINCTFHDMGFDGINLSQTARVMVSNCLFDTITGNGITCSSTTTSDGPTVIDSVFYNISGAAISLAGNAMAMIDNNLFESIGGTSAIITSLAGIQYQLMMKRNGFTLITGTKYDTTKVLAQNVTGEVIATTTFFTDAANQDFTVNNVAGGGAGVRDQQVSYPGITTPSYRDYGMWQHQNTGGGGGAGPLIGSGRLVRS